MISALKKFARKNDDTKNRPAMPSGVSSMGQSLQRKFGRGVQYNMKIVIKGDRNTGKSTLLARFQGKPFKEEYIPTNEIQVCSINWSYRVADDVVKVEVWDVVDKGKKKKSDADGLKLANDILETNGQAPGILDAEFLDVYKGTHGCIILLDITKQWTFKYVERELPKIPQNIPVLILSNFLDMQEHRVVQRDEIASFIKYYDRGDDAAIIQYADCCLKNGFGLKFIHKFFNIPFLKLQQETLEKQLKTNKEDMEATLEELAFHRNTEEQDYDQFLAYMEKKANEKKQPSQPPKTLSSDVKSSPSATPKSSTPTVNASKLTNRKPGASKTTTDQPNSIDDFVPEDAIDSTFLDETDKERDRKIAADSSQNNTSDDSDSDKVGNPMVSGFQDISSEDENEGNINNTQETSKTLQKPNSSFDVDIDLTSDESDEADGVEVTQETTITIPKVVDSDDDKDDEASAELIIEPVKPKVQETKYDVVLNDEDNNFMDAWLDSPSSDPREIKVKSGKENDKKKSTISTNDLDMFEASQLTLKSSSSTKAVDENSLSDVEEEKKKKHSEKKQSRESEDGKNKHRSKQKHKKKSKTKDSEDGEMESSEKKRKSKKKSRHKESKSREKSEGTGADYESF